MTEAAFREDVHFREPLAGDILDVVPALASASAPASRSLQLINSDMTQRKERPIRAPDDLLSVDGIAERLAMSRAAIYRLVARHSLPVYRLPGGMRFKVSDVDAFLESHRTEVQQNDAI